MRRGTECCVPIMPGLVRVAVVPSKSFGPTSPARTRRITSSYAATNAAKSSASAPFTFGTSSVRVPSRFFMSTARPRFTCGGRTTPGLPASSVKLAFIAGTWVSARTTA